MLHKSDVKWWILETEKHPESASDIIEELARRLSELDAENERLRDEIVRLQHQRPARGSAPSVEAAEPPADVRALQQQVDRLQSLLHSDATDETTLVLLSDRLQAARAPLSLAHRLAREERPALSQQARLRLRCAVPARPGETLLLFTSRGRCLTMAISDIAPLIEAEGDWPTGDPPALAENERLTAAVSVGRLPRFWTVATRRGYVRQFLNLELQRATKQGDVLIESPFPHDGPVAAVSGDRGDLLALTRWGKGVRFPHRAIESGGSTALALEPDDAVISALSLPEEGQTALVTASGFGVRRNAAQIRTRAAPGGEGQTLIQAFDLLGAFLIEPDAPSGQLLFLTYAGKIVFVPLDEIPLYTRSSKGARLRTFDRDPAVAAAFVPDHTA